MEEIRGDDGEILQVIMDPDEVITRDEFAALAGALVIGIGRVYDVLLSILMESNIDQAVQLREMHIEGHLYFPPPAFVEDEE